jgi:ankyrin repeat protein
MNLAEVVRRIVADDPASLHRRMSRNEGHQMPLHFAVRMHRPGMVSLLMELGADPLAVDDSGHTAAMYATEPGTDRRVMERIRAMTASELLSAERGQRPARSNPMDLVATLALGDWTTAAQLGDAGGVGAGVLHLMAKRGDGPAVRWLLDRGADPNARWAHWDSEVTPLHLAVLGGHPDIVRQLLDAGADPGICDSMHDSDALGWAQFFGRGEIARILTPRAGT